MSEFKDGAKPLTAATIGNMCGAVSITTYTQSFFVGPVTAEFGWSAGQFFLGYTITAILTLCAAPLVGSLAQKYGIRPMAMIGISGQAFIYFLLSINPNSLVLWYLTWAMCSFLTAGALPIVWTSVLNSWFIKNRGKAIGVTMAGSGVAAFILPPVAQFLIDDYGWRTAYQFIGFGAFLISLPVVFFWFKEKLVEVSATAEATAQNWGITRAEAIRTWKFWNLAIVLFLSVFVVVGLLSNFKPILVAKGAEAQSIALLAAVMGITIVFGRLLVGALVDKFWAPAVACVIFSLLIVGILILLFMPFNIGVGLTIAIAVGLAAGAELDLLAYLTAKYFGPKNYSAIFGGIFAIFGIGSGIAPPIFGEIATQSGSYNIALYIALVALILAIPLFLALGAYPKDALKETEH